MRRINNTIQVIEEINNHSNSNNNFNNQFKIIIHRITYIYAITNGIHIKIGYSSNVKRRLKQLNTGSSEKLYVLCTFLGGRELEQEIHKKFGYNQIQGEWFRVDQDMLDYINSMSQDRYVDWCDGNNGNNGSNDERKLIGYFKMKM